MNDFILFPPFGSLLCLVFRDRSMNPRPACLIPLYTPEEACSQHIVFAGPTLSLRVPHCLCGSHIVFEGALCTEPRQGRDYTSASSWDIIIWYAKDRTCQKKSIHIQIINCTVNRMNLPQIQIWRCASGGGPVGGV